MKHCCINPNDIALDVSRMSRKRLNKKNLLQSHKYDEGMFLLEISQDDKPEMM
jgi:hypothetical protein